MITYRNNYRYAYMNRLIPTHRTPCSVSGEGLEEVTPQYQQAHLPPRSCFLMPFSNEGNQGSLGKGPTLGLGQKIYKMSSEYLVVPESKEMP